MHVDVSDFLIWFVIGVTGWGVRHLRSVLKWRKVRKMAAAEIKSPIGTNDPELAVQNALDTIQKKRIRRESQTLTHLLNGDHTGPHRKG